MKSRSCLTANWTWSARIPSHTSRVNRYIRASHVKKRLVRSPASAMHVPRTVTTSTTSFNSTRSATFAATAATPNSKRLAVSLSPRLLSIAKISTTTTSATLTVRDFTVWCYLHQLFAGTCERPYPPPENDALRDAELLQCIVCEDWYHAVHLELEKSSFDEHAVEIVCRACTTRLPWLMPYAAAVEAEIARRAAETKKTTTEVRLPLYEVVELWGCFRLTLRRQLQVSMRRRRALQLQRPRTRSLKSIQRRQSTIERRKAPTTATYKRLNQQRIKSLVPSTLLIPYGAMPSADAQLAR